MTNQEASGDKRPRSEVKLAKEPLSIPTAAKAGLVARQIITGVDELNLKPEDLAQHGVIETPELRAKLVYSPTHNDAPVKDALFGGVAEDNWVFFPLEHLKQMDDKLQKVTLEIDFGPDMVDMLLPQFPDTEPYCYLSITLEDEISPEEEAHYGSREVVLFSDGQAFYRDHFTSIDWGMESDEWWQVSEDDGQNLVADLKTLQLRLESHKADS